MKSALGGDRQEIKNKELERELKNKNNSSCAENDRGSCGRRAKQREKGTETAVIKKGTPGAVDCGAKGSKDQGQGDEKPY